MFMLSFEKNVLLRFYVSTL